MIFPPDGYWQEIERICRQYDVLLCADEVIGGFGRTGEWFAHRHFGFEPDLICMAKGLTSGYVPMGGLIMSRRIGEALVDKGCLRARADLFGAPGRGRRRIGQPRRARARRPRGADEDGYRAVPAEGAARCVRQSSARRRDPGWARSARSSSRRTRRRASAERGRPDLGTAGRSGSNSARSCVRRTAD